MRSLFQAGLLALATTCFSSIAVAQNPPNAWDVLEDTTWTVKQCVVGDSAVRCSDAGEPQQYPLDGDYIDVSRTIYPGGRFVLVKTKKPPRVHVFDSVVRSAGLKEIIVDTETYRVPYIQTDFLDATGVEKRLEISLIQGGDLPEGSCDLLLKELSGSNNGLTACDSQNQGDIIHWSICTVDQATGGCTEPGEVQGQSPPGDGQGTGSGEG